MTQLSHLTPQWGRILEWHPSLTLPRVKHFTRKLEERADGSGEIWGWLDDTFTEICRPTEDQELYYSGYKKKHCLKWQGLVTPDGLIASLADPYVEEVNDRSHCQSFDLIGRLRQVRLLFLVYDR